MQRLAEMTSPAPSASNKLLRYRPNWNALSESDIWPRGAHMDSRTVNLQMEIHGDTLKFSDYNEVVHYVNRGDMKGLVRDKIGQNMTDTLNCSGSLSRIGSV